MAFKNVALERLLSKIFPEQKYVSFKISLTINYSETRMRWWQRAWQRFLGQQQKRHLVQLFCHYKILFTLRMSIKNSLLSQFRPSILENNGQILAQSNEVEADFNIAQLLESTGEDAFLRLDNSCAPYKVTAAALLEVPTRGMGHTCSPKIKQFFSLHVSETKQGSFVRPHTKAKGTNLHANLRSKCEIFAVTLELNVIICLLL